MLSELTEREFEILKIILSQGLLLGVGGFILFLLQQRVSHAHARSKARYEQSLSVLSELIQRIDQTEAAIIEILTQMHNEIRLFEKRIHERVGILMKESRVEQSMASDRREDHDSGICASSSIDANNIDIVEFAKWVAHQDKQHEEFERRMEMEEKLELKVRDQIIAIVGDQWPDISSEAIGDLVAKGELDSWIFSITRDYVNLERNISTYALRFAADNGDAIFPGVFARVRRHASLLTHYVISFSPEGVITKERHRLIDLTSKLPELALSLTTPYANMADHEIVISYQCAAMRLVARRMVAV